MSKYEGRSIEDYIELTGVEADKDYEVKEANEIIDKHVASLYKGRVKLREGWTKTGYEIAEVLYDIEFAIYEAVEKEFKDDE